MKRQWFDALTDREKRDTYIVFLEDGRTVRVPAVVYRHIQDAAFKHGIAWARKHPAEAEAK